MALWFIFHGINQAGKESIEGDLIQGKDYDFVGQIKAVNTNNPDDFEIIQITLNTAKNKATSTPLVLQRFFQHFPMFEKIPNQII